MNKYLDLLAKTVRAALFCCENDQNKTKKTKEKYFHLLDTLTIGRLIAGENISPDLEGALFLHDIGAIASFTKADHAQKGYDLLKEEGISSAELLLPIRYHEDDLTWRKLLSADAAFRHAAANVQSRIIFNCKCVRDADIISNMILIADDIPSESSFNPALICCLFNKEPGLMDDVLYPADRLIYAFCGLFLLDLEDSVNFIRESGIVSYLVNKLLKMISGTCNETLACMICRTMQPFCKNDLACENIYVPDCMDELDCSLPATVRKHSDIFREKFFYFTELMRTFDLSELSEKIQPVIKGSLAWTLNQADFYREPKDFDIGIIQKRKKDNTTDVLKKLSEWLCSIYDCDVLPHEASDIVTLRCYYQSVFNEEAFFELEMTIMNDDVPTEHIKMLLPLFVDIVPAFISNMPPVADIKWLFVDKIFTAEKVFRNHDEKKLHQCRADLTQMLGNPKIKSLISVPSELEKIIRIRAEEEKMREISLYEGSVLNLSFIGADFQYTDM